jgi:hypothetical protein
MVTDPWDGPESTPTNPYLEADFYLCLVPATVFIVIVLLICAIKNHFCGILQPVLDLAVTAFPSKNFLSLHKLESAICWLIILSNFTGIHPNSRDISIVSLLLVISNIQNFLKMSNTRKRPTTSGTDALLSKYLGTSAPTGAAGGAAVASAGPMLTTQLTDEQKQNKNWTERGEQLFRDLAPEKAVNIRRTLSKIKQD